MWYLFAVWKDMEELKKEAREARRIKMLHQPSKVGMIMLTVELSISIGVCILFHQYDHMIHFVFSRRWIWKMKYEFYVRHLLRSPRIVLIF
jgi:hypothetical protein